MAEESITTRRLAVLREICRVLERHRQDGGDDGTLWGDGGETAESVAQQWIDAGFDDPEEIDEWLHARCSGAAEALALEVAGITPAQAAMLTRAGTRDYEDTLGHKFIRGDLSLAEARRIITSEFWNS